VETADLCRDTNLLPKCTRIHEAAYCISIISGGNTADSHTSRPRERKEVSSGGKSMKERRGGEAVW